MLKFYSLLLGENPRYVATFQPASKRKIILYANCLMVPVILWFINSFLLVSHVLGGSIFTALTTGVIAAFIIFLIERAIIMASDSKVILIFRVCLGFIVATLGSVSFDEVVFKADIDNKVAEYKSKASEAAIKNVSARYSENIAKHRTSVEEKSKNWNNSLKDAKEESDGTGGSRQKMVGEIANLKLKIAERHEADYTADKERLNNLLEASEQDKIKAKSQVEANFNDKALLLRIRAMFDLVREDTVMLIVYILFTTLLFLLEFLVVIIKMCSKKSIDEELEVAREVLLREKTQKLLDRRAILFSPEQFTPSVRNAENVLSSSYNALL
jgi:hypothetical protein